jgi:NAD(P)-dependent dehydrogenase (short-subunit alcohol dehydrogenase family)
MVPIRWDPGEGAALADLHDRPVLLVRGDGALAAGLAEGLAEARATVVVGSLPEDDEERRGRADRVERLGGRLVPLAAPDGGDGTPDAWRAWFERARDAVGPPHAVVLDLEVPGAPARVELDDPDGCRDWSLAHLPPSLFRLAAALRGPEPAPTLLLLLPARPVGGRPCLATAIATAAIEALVAGIAPAPARIPVLGVQPGALDPAFGAGLPLEGQIVAREPRTREERWAESPRLVGRCVAALCKDPDLGERHGRVADVRSLVGDYRLRDLDGAVPGLPAPAGGAEGSRAH